MLRSLYDWAMRLAASRYAPFALPVNAAIEEVAPFVPPDVMLATMVLARRERAWFYAALCTIGSVAGGCVAYALGAMASDGARHFLASIGRAQAVDAFNALYAKVGLAVILVKGLTPVPFMVVTWASGLAHFSLPVFIGASLVTRGGRFFLGAALMQHPKAKEFVDRNLTALAIAGFVLIAVALVLIRLVEKHAAG
jgi:membrane protein YqaA with SNARE-associated domain